MRILPKNCNIFFEKHQIEILELKNYNNWNSEFNNRFHSRLDTMKTDELKDKEV